MRGFTFSRSAVAALSFIPLTAGLVLPAGCDRAPGPSTKRVPPNVVLVVLDTLRQDHLSCYGYARPTSPNIDRLAAAATLYRDCITPSPWTLPAHASMFTGKYSWEHGARLRGGTSPSGTTAYSLPETELTLAEFLQAEGYATAGFVANAGNCGRWTGLAQGFDTYYLEHVYADLLLPHAFEWLERRDERPFFLFLNFMDNHRPYNVTPRPGFIDPPADPDAPGVARRFTRTVLHGKRAAPPELRQKLIDQYDTSVANVDEQVGRLLEKLRTLGLFESSLIVITSDHGEYFGEHQLAGHSKDIYQPVLQVPLVVKLPGQQRGQVVEQRVSLVALPNLIGAQLPEAAAAQARAQFPEAVGAPVVFAEKYPSGRRGLEGKPWAARVKRLRRAVFSGPYKYIHSSDQRHELYDLARDPGETTNLVSQSPEQTARLAALLDGFLTDRQKATPTDAAQPPVSEEELRMLARLGYVDAPEEKEAAPAEEDPNRKD